MYFHFVVVHMHVQSCFFLPVKTYWFIAVLVAVGPISPFQILESSLQVSYFPSLVYHNFELDHIR